MAERARAGKNKKTEKRTCLGGTKISVRWEKECEPVWGGDSCQRVRMKKLKPHHSVRGNAQPHKGRSGGGQPKKKEKKEGVPGGRAKNERFKEKGER